MKIKELIGKVLMVLTKHMLIVNPASAATVGVEDMPESMKKMR
ncbi:hypothetical protein [Clostridium sp. ZBS12]|nr:hypothetical protein [Clostridium sp. ZBS12]